jgi:hypothetical protein
MYSLQALLSPVVVVQFAGAGCKIVSETRTLDMYEVESTYSSGRNCHR